MRYAMYLASESAGCYSADNDYFAVYDNIEQIDGQVSEFLTWMDGDDMDELTFERKSKLAKGHNVTLKGCLNYICIRPIKEM